MMSKTLFFVPLLAVVGLSMMYAGGSAEDIPAAYEEYPQALGFQYGEISATGLSYQRWGGRTGLMVTGGIIYVPYDANSYLMWFETTLDYAVGAEVQYRVYGEDFAQWLSGQLYVFAGLKHRGYIPLNVVEEGRVEPDEIWVEPTYAAGSYQPVIGLGGGIGIEIILFRHFSLPLELGYGVDWSPLAGEIGKQFNVNLRPQVGFRYRY